MGKLAQLFVTKISLVQRAANRRPFLLAKSGELDTDGNPLVPDDKDDESKTDTHIINKTESVLNKHTNLEVDYSMDKEIRSFVANLVKSGEKDASALLLAVKKEFAEKANTIGDDNLRDTCEFIASIAAPVVKSDPGAEKTAGELLALQKSNESLRNTVNELQVELRKSSLREWYEKNAQYAEGKVEDHINTIVELEKLNPAFAENFKNQLIATSKAVAASGVLDEDGADGEGRLAKKESAVDELLKSGELKTPEDFRTALNKMTREQYEQYRQTVTASRR